MNAFEKGHLEVIKKLLANRFNNNHENKDGYLEVIITILINSAKTYDKIKELNFIIDQMKIKV